MKSKSESHSILSDSLRPHGLFSSSGFPYFLQFKSEFDNKLFMIWATISSESCFCWLYRAYPSLAAKNIINLISGWPSGDVHVSSLFLCCWKRVFAMTNAFSWQNSILDKICPASFCTPRSNLPVTPCISWSYFSIPVPYNAKNIINLILVLTIWWCPCVESSLVLLEEGVCYDQCVLLANLLAFALLRSVLQGQICLLLQVTLDFLLLYPTPL